MQGSKEQTDMVVSAHTSSIIKRMEQVVSQKMKRMLPSLVPNPRIHYLLVT